MSRDNDLFIGIFLMIVLIVGIVVVVACGWGKYIPQERSVHEIETIVRDNVKPECLK